MYIYPIENLMGYKEIICVTIADQHTFWIIKYNLSKITTISKLIFLIPSSDLVY
jgi:hypothetical protein